MKKLICAVTVLAVSTAQAATIYVDANCPGPGMGTVRDPYCSIQTAIDNAVDTDEIVVAPGTYFETIDFLGKAIWLHSWRSRRGCWPCSRWRRCTPGGRFDRNDRARVARAGGWCRTGRRTPPRGQKR